MTCGTSVCRLSSGGRPEPTDMKTAIYTRLSKDRTGLSENCAIQLSECRAYLRGQGWMEVLALEENDISGSQYSTKPRPKYETELIPAIEQGYVEVILVTEMPRLYRRMEELIELINLAQTTSLQLIQTTDGIRYDLSTPEGRKAAMDAVSNAIYETAKLSRRLLRKKAVRASQGKYLGGYRAYGYEGPQYDEEGTLLNRGRINMVVIESEAAVIKNCVERLIVGERSTTIIRDLNQNGIPSPAGKQWTIGNFKRTITRKRHVIFDDSDTEQRGTLEYRGREYQARWPGLITRYQHELMMARFAETQQPWAHGLKHGRTYLLSGMIYCECGKTMIGSRRQLGDGSMQRRYRCRKFDNHGNLLGCGKLFRRAEAVDLLVTEAALGRLEDPKVAEALTRQGEPAEARRLFDKLSNLQTHRKEIVAEYGRGEHTKADYKALLLAADEAIAAIQAQLAKYNQARATSVAGNLDKLRETWDSASLDWRRSAISLVVERVIVHPMKPIGAAVWHGYRFDPNSVEIVWRAIKQPVQGPEPARRTTARHPAGPAAANGSRAAAERKTHGA